MLSLKDTLDANTSTSSKLQTARTIRTNLGSTGTANFDGSANVTPGVTGTLPIANGGTGATNVTVARANLVVPTAGALNDIENLTDMNTYPTFVGSICDTSNAWWNMISVRHRNNTVHATGDGRIVYPRLNANGDLYWKKQASANTGWIGERKILDSVNFNGYIPKLDGTGATGTWGINISGTATSASKLATARNIKLGGAVTGTVSFNGTADVTIASTIRNATIDANFKTSYRTETFGSTSNGAYITAIRNNTSGVTEAPTHGSGLAFGHTDTHGYLYTSYNSPIAYLGGGNANKLNWVKQLAFKDDISSITSGYKKIDGSNYFVKLTSNGDNTVGYRLVLQETMSAWKNSRMLISVASQHQGIGTISIAISMSRALDSYSADIRYIGGTTQFSTDSWTGYYNTETGVFSLFWKYWDYSSCYVTILEKTGFTNTITNGTWITAIDTDTYGTPIKISMNSASSIGTSTVGSATKPIYINNGVPTAGVYTLADACAKKVKTLSAVGNTGWSNQADGDSYLVTKAFMAFWNGRYNDGASNLAYCNKGAFGNVVVKNITDSGSAGAIGTSANVPTERDIYYGLPTINGNHTYTSSTNIFAPTTAGTKGQQLVSNGTGAPVWAEASSGGGLASVPIGAIIPYAGTTEPEGFKFTNGQAISRTEYSEIFAIIGTTYGAGDGSTTFNLPDLRGRTVVARNESDSTYFGTLGKKLGENTHVLTVAELASHNHTFTGNKLTGSGSGTVTIAGYTAATNGNGMQGGPVRKYILDGNVQLHTSEHILNTGTISFSATPSGTIGNTGSGTGHNNIQPSMVTNMIIRVKNTATNIEQIDIEALKQEILNEVGNSIAAIPIGGGCDYYGSSAPEGFLFANGAAISRTTYAELFEVIGTTYGAGDGSTTFNLPDKRKRVSVMYDNSDTTFNTLGKKGGETAHTLTTNEIPAHNHKLYNFNGVIKDSTAYKWYVGSYANAGSSQSTQWGTFNTGGGAAHNNMPPYLVCNYIIKAK